MIFRLFAMCWSCLAFGYCCAQLNVIPQPDEWNIGNGQFVIDEKTTIVSNKSARAEAEFFVVWLSAATGRTFRVSEMNEMPVENFILINASKKSSEVTEERLKSLPDSLRKKVLQADRSRYRMNITAKGVLINAEFDEGAFYGVQTLRQLLPVSAQQKTLKLPYVLPAMLINDGAHFPHRGLLLDCCRHFMSVDFIKKYIDALAYYKMNVLHWHLTEDQGWRIQIDKYPLLTKVGGWRTEKDGSQYGGFYTKEQIREIVSYAASRHVTVIPEIELPGHSTAAIAAYPALSCTHEPIAVENEWGVFKDIYCAGDEYTFEFLENVLAEVCELFPSPYIHIGGDEAPKFRWEHCNQCQRRMKQEKLKNEAELQTYFIERIAAFLATKGKRIIGWDEILEGGIPADAMIQSWRGMEGGEHAAKEHHDVVMSPTSHCYFDYGLNATDLEEVYNFNPIPPALSAAEARYIRGGECNMWTEHAPQELVDGKVFPRLLALAEVLWTYPQQRNYEAFYKRVEAHYPRLQAMDIVVGFPKVPIEVKIGNGYYSEMLATIEPLISSANVSVRQNENQEFKACADSMRIAIDGPTTLEFKVEFAGATYPDALKWTYDPHLGWNKDIRLNYVPSPYYTGGGNKALNDGRLGTSNFRDGIWQAVQGTDMSVVIDFGQNRLVSEFSSRWFHYGNAWIFLPTLVEYAVSQDGQKWEVLSTAESVVNERTEGELVVPIPVKLNKSVSARYVRMIAKNHGPCPAWHDAPGEPSWLFCDEFVIH